MCTATGRRKEADGIREKKGVLRLPLETKAERHGGKSCRDEWSTDNKKNNTIQTDTKPKKTASKQMIEAQ